MQSSLSATPNYCTLQSSSVFRNSTEFNSLKITKYVLCSVILSVEQMQQDTAAWCLHGVWCLHELHDACMMSIIHLTAHPLLTRTMEAEHIGCVNHVCPLSTLCALVNIPTCPNFSMGITPHWTPAPRLIGFTADSWWWPARGIGIWKNVNAANFSRVSAVTLLLCTSSFKCMKY